MTQALSQTLLTFEEYCAYDDGTDTRYQLEAGVLTPMPPESPRNSRIALWLLTHFLPFVPLNQLTNKAEIFVGGSRATCRLPDLMVLSLELAAILETETREPITFDMPPPLLVVEVVSPGKKNEDRDYRYKRSEYAARGIIEYWIVDPGKSHVMILTLVEGLYEEKNFSGGDRIQSEIFKELNLIIFDNLDRVPKGVSDHLFFDYAAQLQELHCTLIYTVPLAALYSPRNMSNTFGSPNIVPMVNIFHFERDRCDLAYNEPVLAKMASVIEQRVDVDAVFADRESLLELARSSGGHVRQLMQIMQTSCLTASTRGHAKIEKDDVLYAVNKAQFEFERLIPAEYYPLLAQTCVTKNVSKDETGQLMLFNTSVLEYNGTNRWNDVNPLVKKIDAFQQSLEAFQAL